MNIQLSDKFLLAIYDLRRKGKGTTRQAIVDALDATVADHRGQSILAQVVRERRVRRTGQNPPYEYVLTRVGSSYTRELRQKISRQEGAKR